MSNILKITEKNMEGILSELLKGVMSKDSLINLLKEDKEFAKEILKEVFPGIDIPDLEPVARIGSIFVIKSKPKIFYSINTDAGIIGVKNLNGTEEISWRNRITLTDKEAYGNGLTKSDVEKILYNGLNYEDIYILPEPKELLEKLNIS